MSDEYTCDGCGNIIAPNVVFEALESQHFAPTAVCDYCGKETPINCIPDNFKEWLPGKNLAK